MLFHLNLNLYFPSLLNTDCTGILDKNSNLIMTLITDFVCWYFVMVALGEEELLVIPFRLLIAVIGGVPFVALVICVAISVLFHFEESTSTHCNVSNALPSVSASVSLAPERYIWRILINLHCVPRFAIAFAYRLVMVLYLF